MEIKENNLETLKNTNNINFYQLDQFSPPYNPIQINYDIKESAKNNDLYVDNIYQRRKFSLNQLENYADDLKNKILKEDNKLNIINKDSYNQNKLESNSKQNLYERLNQLKEFNNKQFHNKF